MRQRSERLKVWKLAIPAHGFLHERIAFCRWKIDDGFPEADVIRAKCELADGVLEATKNFFRRERVPIPFIVRAKVMARDNFQCKACSSGDDLTIDHIIPHSKGGSDQEDNLRTLCALCNSKKGARLDDA